ncbi:transposase [Streptomyces sp. NPDC008079]|uniref:transposase n=1 Tax=Streptomyces sp. NPDC008079 TaxID=3364806 RepID=UPI0036EDE2A7
MALDVDRAALYCVAPVPVSSGRTHRHRLSRSGDREPNSALYRMSGDARTREYVARQTVAEHRGA